MDNLDMVKAEIVVVIIAVLFTIFAIGYIFYNQVYECHTDVSELTFVVNDKFSKVKDNGYEEFYLSFSNDVLLVDRSIYEKYDIGECVNVKKTRKTESKGINCKIISTEYKILEWEE